ncbi:GDSL esterase/lipase At1g29670-like [Rhododendron vialii]|uniref:GDSL esterase/lipase At1g29670-like n=1 Tax=Rhododendron vialii TaxID=182163 RepID=UPI0026603309|nr:GDSL esterase/lipase At1g29670-like [Rhododendron vialii]
MAPKLETWLILLPILSFFNLHYFVVAKPQVPCYFIFGDSGVDNGNNLGLKSTGKADFRPYGVDLPSGVPTGRFTNGRTATDLLAELLGFNTYPPPYVTVSGEEILAGVNYGSSGAGIRQESGRLLGDRFTMDEQLKNHLLIASRIADILGSNEAATKHLNKCIYSLTLGSNDFIGNYFVPVFPTRELYTIHRWCDVVIKRYGQQLRTLYNYGARKIVTFSLQRLGCAPAVIAVHGGRRSRDPGNIYCIEKISRAAELFNGRLLTLVDELNAELPDAKFVYVDIFTQKPTDLIPYGFKVVNTACCKLPPGTLGFCLPGGMPCEDRDDYVFWDGYHTSEAVNKIIANKSYTSMSPDGVYPINIAQLAKLQI